MDGESISDILLWALMLGAAQTVGALIVERFRQKEGSDPLVAIAHILDDHLERIGDALEVGAEVEEVIEVEEEQPKAKRGRNV
jgi:predicted RNA-binding protein with RPS1 domain